MLFAIIDSSYIAQGLPAVMPPYLSCSLTKYWALFIENSRKPDTNHENVYSDLFIFSLRGWNGPSSRPLPRHCSEVIMNAMASLITECLGCLLNCVLRRRSKKTSKFRDTAFVRGIHNLWNLILTIGLCCFDINKLFFVLPTSSNLIELLDCNGHAKPYVCGCPGSKARLHIRYRSSWIDKILVDM